MIQPELVLHNHTITAIYDTKHTIRLNRTAARLQTRGGILLNSVEALLPLTEAFYYILVALYAEPAHGYGIMQDVEAMTGGRVRIGAGTLYTALNTLLKKGLIEHSAAEDDVDLRRKTYAITETGKQVLSAEIERLEELLENGRQRMNIGSV